MNTAIIRFRESFSHALFGVVLGHDTNNLNGDLEGDIDASKLFIY